MPISPEDLTVHFTSTLMALIRTALEIKLASGEREVMSDSTRGLQRQLVCWLGVLPKPPREEILAFYSLPAPEDKGASGTAEGS